MWRLLGAFALGALLAGGAVGGVWAWQANDDDVTFEERLAIERQQLDEPLQDIERLCREARIDHYESEGLSYRPERIVCEARPLTRINRGRWKIEYTEGYADLVETQCAIVDIALWRLPAEAEEWPEGLTWTSC